MSFNSVMKYLRTKTFPTDAIPFYQESQNADPICDLNGAQWVRDAQTPVLPGPGPTAYSWFNPAATSFVLSYIYRVIATADEHVGAWDTEKLYLQIHTGGINPGDTPLFSGAVPDGPGILDVDFGASTPFNGGVFYFAFSSTPLVYTASLRTAHLLFCGA